MDIRKVYLLILLCTFCILSPVYTQQSLSDEFRKVAGDYAALYTSKVEVGYSPYLYINHPYWDTDEFKKGAVCYGGLVYTDLQLRYDTFKKQLIVITPEKRILLQVDMRKVDYFIIGDKKFVPHNDTFAAILYDSPQMRLTQYVQCKMGTPVEKGRISYRQFEKPARFVLSKDGVQETSSSLLNRPHSSASGLSEDSSITPHMRPPLLYVCALLVVLNYTHAISFCQVFRRVNHYNSRKIWYMVTPRTTGA